MNAGVVILLICLCFISSSGCKDTHDYCPWVASLNNYLEGYCKTHKSLMAQMCPVTCELCRSIIVVSVSSETIALPWLRHSLHSLLVFPGRGPAPPEPETAEPVTTEPETTEPSQPETEEPETEKPPAPTQAQSGTVQLRRPSSIGQRAYLKQE